MLSKLESQSKIHINISLTPKTHAFPIEYSSKYSLHHLHYKHLGFLLKCKSEVFMKCLLIHSLWGWLWKHLTFFFLLKRLIATLFLLFSSQDIIFLLKQNGYVTLASGVRHSNLTILYAVLCSPHVQPLYVTAQPYASTTDHTPAVPFIPVTYSCHN